MTDSHLIISCYMNAEYADETYWFLRNKKGDNISKKLFTAKKFQLPMTMMTLKEAIFAYLDVELVDDLNLTPEFKDYMLLKVGSVSVNRAKIGAKAAINKFKCKPIPDDAVFENGGLALDIILMPIATKSSSTKKRGGTSTTPLSVIKSVTQTFIAEQTAYCKLGSPIALCFDKLQFTGTSLERQKAIGSLVMLHCSNTDLLADYDIVAAGENVKGNLVIERIKDRITNLDINCHFPANCVFKRVNANLQAWRRAAAALPLAAEDEEEDHQSAPTKKRRRIAEKKPCECSAPNNGKDLFRITFISLMYDEDNFATGFDKFCGRCGGTLEEPLLRCCGKDVKTTFCTQCGMKPTPAIQSFLEELIDENNEIIEVI